jgi:hypothetical protein
MPYWPRKTAAVKLTDEFFQVAERTLLEWDDVPIVILNGKAHAKADDWRRAAVPPPLAWHAATPQPPRKQPKPHPGRQQRPRWG